MLTHPTDAQRSCHADVNRNHETMQRHSGLQQDVFSLYRRILRVAKEKDIANGRNGSKLLDFFQSEEKTTASYAREQFRKEAKAVKRSDFKTIEYQIRRGDKQLKLLKMPGVKGVS